MALTTSPAAEAQTPIGRNEIQLQSDRMTPEALWAMGRIGSTSVSPDSKLIAYTVSYYSVEQNRSRTRIYLMNADGTNQRAVSKDSQANVSETDPTFIKQGTELAFLCAGDIWSFNINSNETRQLTRQGDIEGFLFSPDEKHVILIRQVTSTSSIAAQ